MANSAPYTVHASTIARVHTILSYSAFITALFIGCALHYKKIVKNGVAGWPQEWFPSVSATIGDWYPERNLFQILIALTSGPRFAVLLFSYYLHRLKASTSRLPSIMLATGCIRTLSCGGWVYITSSDDHDVHDILMIFYIVCNIPWMYGGIILASSSTRRKRTATATAFWAALVPMIYFFIQHKVHRVPGAYTHYSFFEWSLILLDIAFDAMTELEFRENNVQITVALPQAGSGQSVEYEVYNRLHRLAKTTVSVKPASTNGVASAKIVASSSREPEGTPSADSKSPTVLSAARPTLSFLADVYFSYQTWTLLTALPTTLFYFSVWKLALAGPEFSTFATLSPLFLASPTILSFAQSRSGRVVLLAIGGVVGIGCWKAESVWTRLGGVVIGVMTGLLKWGAEWEEGRPYHAIVFTLGLLVSSLSKHLNHGNNPAWPIVDEKSGGYHISILALCLLALIELSARPASSPSPPALKSTDDAGPSTASEKTTSSGTSVTPSHTPWFPSALALGALLYSLHERLTDASTLIVWSWTGYPLTGPSPHVHAPLTFIAQSLGVLIALIFIPSSSTSTRVFKILDHPVWWAVGATSTYVLYMYKDWLGYSGALVHTIFLTSITPFVLRDAGFAMRGIDGARGKRVARVLTVAWLVWILFLFMGTFTVAYAFVPGAGPFREHTDYVLAAQIVLLSPAFRWNSLFTSPGARSLLSSSFYLPRTLRTHSLALLSLIPLVALLSPLTRPPSPPPAPSAAHQRGRILNAGIWTVHFGIDDAGRDSQRRMRNLVRDMELDVFGLLETDLHRPVYGNRDLTRVMSEELGYYVDIGPGPNQHTWGAALFSKFPILKSTHHLLPSPYGELAPAIEAVLDMYGVNVTVVVAHNGQEETPLDRELQATELARIMAASYPDPVIFLGYVVTKPKAHRPAPYLIMTQDGRVHDIDGEDNDRWCEYIFYRGLYRTAYARVSRSTITDTELQIGQFVVPRYGKPVTNDTHEARYLRSWKEDLPVEHWFPMEYYGNKRHGGVNGHFYHVFDTPLYYKLPEGAEV